MKFVHHWPQRAPIPWQVLHHQPAVRASYQDHHSKHRKRHEIRAAPGKFCNGKPIEHTHTHIQNTHENRVNEKHTTKIHNKTSLKE